MMYVRVHFEAVQLCAVQQTPVQFGTECYCILHAVQLQAVQHSRLQENLWQYTYVKKSQVVQASIVLQSRVEKGLGQHSTIGYSTAQGSVVLQVTVQRSTVLQTTVQLRKVKYEIQIKTTVKESIVLYHTSGKQFRAVQYFRVENSKIQGNTSTLLEVRVQFRAGSCVKWCAAKLWQHCKIELHCTALRCTAVHCTAIDCDAQKCTALRCTAMNCTAIDCDALKCTALCSLTFFGLSKDRDYMQRQDIKL